MRMSSSPTRSGTVCTYSPRGRRREVGSETQLRGDGDSLHVFTSLTEGWSRKVHDADRGPGEAIPMIVRADGTNNGTWFHYRHLYVQNEDTGKRLPNHLDTRSYTQLLVQDIEPPARSPESSLRSLLPRPGFRAELMAAEPLVMDCIDIQWDRTAKPGWSR